MRKIVVIFILTTALAQALAQIQNLLATALKQNPGLVAQIRNNPALLANLQSALLRDQRSQQVTTSPNLNAFSSFGSLPKPQLQQPQQQPVDQCSALRRQNKRLKDLLHTLTADDITEVPRSQELALDLLPSSSSPSLTRLTSGGIAPNANLLAHIQEQAKQPQPAEHLASSLLKQLPSVSLTSRLVTPSATWTELLSTTSYRTTITQTESTEVPILWRGKKIVTTIFDTNTQVVSATEIKTSSVLITPAPTWSTETVTITPSASLPTPQVKPKNVLERATVLEIDKATSPLEASQRLNTLKQVYNLFNDRQPSQLAKRLVNNLSGPIKHGNTNNPLFDDFDDFDQQALAAQQRPVYVPRPNILPQPIAPSSKVFTLYFSGRTPGEYTTSLTTMRVDAQGNPIRQKREASDEEGLGISPSRVQPIQATRAPVTSVQDILNEEDIMEYLQGIADLNEISGSMKTRESSEHKKFTETVTVTETVTAACLA